MTLQLIGTDALADNAVSTDKSQPFGNIILDSSAAGTDVGDKVLLDRTNANGQDAGDAINVEKEILDIVGFNVASRKQLKLGTIILESGTADTADGDILLLDSTASGVDEGEMILYNETFNPATFNIGGTLTAGHAIKVNSAGSGFEFAVGGVQTLIRTVDIQNGDTSVVFTGLNEFALYKVEFIRMRHSTSAGALLQWQCGTDGSTFETGSKYGEAKNRILYNGNNDAGTTATDGAADVDLGYTASDWEGNANHFYDGYCFLYGYGAGDNLGQYPRIQYSIVSSNATSNNVTFTNGSGYANSSATNTSAKFFLNTGNFTVGTMKLYGM